MIGRQTFFFFLLSFYPFPIYHCYEQHDRFKVALQQLQQTIGHDQSTTNSFGFCYGYGDNLKEQILLRDCGFEGAFGCKTTVDRNTGHPIGAEIYCYDENDTEKHPLTATQTNGCACDNEKCDCYCVGIYRCNNLAAVGDMWRLYLDQQPLFYSKPEEFRSGECYNYSIHEPGSSSLVPIDCPITHRIGCRTTAVVDLFYNGVPFCYHDSSPEHLGGITANGCICPGNTMICYCFCVGSRCNNINTLAQQYRDATSLRCYGREPTGKFFVHRCSPGNVCLTTFERTVATKDSRLSSMNVETGCEDMPDAWFETAACDCTNTTCQCRCQGDLCNDPAEILKWSMRQPKVGELNEVPNEQKFDVASVTYSQSLLALGRPLCILLLLSIGIALGASILIKTLNKYHLAGFVKLPKYSAVVNPKNKFDHPAYDVQCDGGTMADV